MSVEHLPARGVNLCNMNRRKASETFAATQAAISFLNGLGVERLPKAILAPMLAEQHRTHRFASHPLNRSPWVHPCFGKAGSRAPDMEQLCHKCGTSAPPQASFGSVGGTPLSWQPGQPGQEVHKAQGMPKIADWECHPAKMRPGLSKRQLPNDAPSHTLDGPVRDAPYDRPYQMQNGRAHHGTQCLNGHTRPSWHPGAGSEATDASRVCRLFGASPDPALPPTAQDARHVAPQAQQPEAYGEKEDWTEGPCQGVIPLAMWQMRVLSEAKHCPGQLS